MPEITISSEALEKREVSPMTAEWFEHIYVCDIVVRSPNHSESGVHGKIASGTYDYLP